MLRQVDRHIKMTEQAIIKQEIILLKGPSTDISGKLPDIHPPDDGNYQTKKSNRGTTIQVSTTPIDEEQDGDEILYCYCRKGSYGAVSHFGMPILINFNLFGRWWAVTTTAVKLNGWVDVRALDGAILKSFSPVSSGMRRFENLTCGKWTLVLQRMYQDTSVQNARPESLEFRFASTPIDHCTRICRVLRITKYIHTYIYRTRPSKCIMIALFQPLWSPWWFQQF